MPYFKTRLPLPSLLLPFLVGLGLRLLRLGSKSLWLDEALLLTRLQASLQEHAAGLGEPYHPPLYYEMMRSWIALWGSSEIALRLPSALLGGAAVPLVWALANSLNLSPGRRQTAVWLTAVSPLLIWYAQEARSYAPLAFLHLLGCWALVRFALVMGSADRTVRVPRSAAGWWVLFVLSSAAALYLHYAAVLILPLQLLFVALWSKPAAWAIRLGWLLGWVEALVLFWPWLQTPTMSWFLKIILSERFYLVEPLSRLLGIGTAGSQMVLLLLATVGLLGGTIAAAWATRRYGSLIEKTAARPAVRAVVAALFIAAVVGIVYPRGYTLKRQLAALWPFVLLGVGWIVPWPTGRAGRSLAPLLVAAALIGSLVNITLIPKAEWRGVADYLDANMGPSDTIVLLPGYDYIVFRYYNDYRKHVTQLTGPPDEALAEAAGRHQAIWIIEDQRDLSGPRNEVYAWLEEHKKLREIENFDLLTIRKFE